MSVVRIDRIKKVVKHIEKMTHESDKLHFDMRDFLLKVEPENSADYEAEYGEGACGTYMCFAGWAAHYDGSTMHTSGGTWGNEVVVIDSSLIKKFNRGKIGTFELPTVAKWAADYFGLDDNVAAMIFYATWLTTIDELKERINSALLDADLVSRDDLPFKV